MDFDPDTDKHSCFRWNREILQIFSIFSVSFSRRHCCEIVKLSEQCKASSGHLGLKPAEEFNLRFSPIQLTSLSIT